MRPTQCKNCNRWYEWERFKKENINDCPTCKPDQWALALNLCGPIKPIAQFPKKRKKKG